jgi:hypothetical protein
LAGGGYYSAYVGAIVDLARIMGNLHTATFQYIPALALPRHDQLNLKLNNPPSFRKPKSVLVVALPAVEPAHLPPLRAVDPNQVFCLQKPSLVLPVEGAPLVFSTALAHDFAMRVQTENGASIELPSTADAAQGGFVIDTRELQNSQLALRISGKLHGFWGFQSFAGPDFDLRSAHAGSKWTIATPDENVLIIGRENTLHLQSDSAACVEDIVLKEQRDEEIQANWKLLRPDQLEIKVALQHETPGPTAALIKQYGVSKPDEVMLQAYSEAAHLDRFAINAEDQQGVLTGTRLAEVAGLDLGGIHFLPAGLSRANQTDELRLSAPNALPATKSEEKLVASVTLKDGRVLALPTTIEPPRPRVTLISKSIQSPMTSPIHLENQDDLPQEGRLSFVLKTEIPDTFPRAEKIEIAASDGSFNVLLSVSDGNLVLQDAHTVLAILDPRKQFGASAFGPLRFRPLAADGLKGDWHPLANLVRVPSLNEIRCPAELDQPCILEGANLFLIESIASDAEFEHTIPVPAGFVDTKVTVPHTDGGFYIKLRDDPSKGYKVVLPLHPE